MNTKFILLSILAVILSFFGGFLVANALNRGEIDKLSAENSQLKKQSEQKQTNEKELNLSEEEIQSRIKEAENNPQDFAVQKGLGLALYSYAGMKQDAKLLEDVEKLLQRAYQINPNDLQVLVGLGNIYYDLGQIKKDSARNSKAREIYLEALKKNPKDTNVLTSKGLTFLYDETPNFPQAIKEFEEALSYDQKNEKALFYMVEAQIGAKNVQNAEKYLGELKKVNPNNTGISELEKKISQNAN